MAVKSTDTFAPGMGSATRLILAEGELEKCNRTPLHQPGHIQSGSFYLQVEKVTETITYCSENIEQVLGHPPEMCVDERAYSICGSAFWNLVRTHSILGRSVLLPVFSRPLRDGEKSAPPIRCLVYEGDAYFGMHLEYQSEESDRLSDSSVQVDMVRPLAGAPFESLEECYASIIDKVKKMLGFERVLIYRFMQDWSGEVVAEYLAANLKDQAEEYLGLRFPSSDIPAIARLMYTVNPVRFISKVDYSPVTIIGGKEQKAPCDLTQNSVRGVSPVHLKYLLNMGIQSGLSIGIVSKGRLWGLISCHQLTGTKNITADQIYWARVFGASVSSEISRIYSNMASDTVANVTYAFSRENLKSKMPALGLVLESIKKNLECDKVAIVSGTTLLSEDSLSSEKTSVSEICEKIDQESDQTWGTDKLISNSSTYLKDNDSAGVLGCRFDYAATKHSFYLICWRREFKHVVQWGGNPDKSLLVEDEKGILTPRTSFSAWQESVSHKCKPWQPRIMHSIRAVAACISSLPEIRQQLES